MSNDNVAQEPVAWQIEVHNKYQTRGGYDERIDVDEWRQTVMLNEPQGPRYRNIRPLYAHPATPAPVEAGLREALAIAESRYRDNGEGFGIIEAIRVALFTALRGQSAPVGGEPVTRAVYEPYPGAFDQIIGADDQEGGDA